MRHFPEPVVQPAVITATLVARNSICSFPPTRIYGRRWLGTSATSPSLLPCALRIQKLFHVTACGIFCPDSDWPSASSAVHSHRTGLDLFGLAHLYATVLRFPGLDHVFRDSILATTSSVLRSASSRFSTVIICASVLDLWHSRFLFLRPNSYSLWGDPRSPVTFTDFSL